jgi:hypothetical protein
MMKSMRLVSKAGWLSIVLLLSSCIFQTVPECPEKAELLSGGWQLTSLEVNDEPVSINISQYRLTLLETGTFTRVNTGGETDSGEWYLTNNETVLTLVPEDQPEEDYIIDFFNLRKLNLLVERDANKVGPDKLKLNLDRFE